MRSWRLQVPMETQKTTAKGATSHFFGVILSRIVKQVVAYAHGRLRRNCLRKISRKHHLQNSSHKS